MDLVFEPSIGRYPEAGSLEEDLLIGCCVEDALLWERLAKTPMHELEEAVRRLRQLGWRFHLTTVH